ncbi:MAG: DegV family protein [Cellulosilyticaceae bacterium]
MSIKVVTDSTSYIPEELLKMYDISVISLNVIINDKSVRELDLSNDSFYEAMAQCKDLPTSSQPTPEEMMSVFEKHIAQGDSVLGVFLSSEMSGTFSSAHMIKEMLLERYPKAEIVLLDSRSNSMQMGYAVVEAAKAAAAGKSMAQVIASAEFVINNSRFVFTPDTLDYLKKGGRIGGASALLGNLLQIKPILTVTQGKTAILTKVRTKKKAVSTIVDTLFDDYSPDELGSVIVHHINCETEGRALASALEEKLGTPIMLQSIGPVIGLHVGPGSIGIAYHKKVSIA